MSKHIPHELSEFEAFEPFDVPPRDQWLINLGKKYDIELAPEGNEFQVGLMLDTTEQPNFAITIAGSQSGKSRAHLIEAIIMASGKVPISMRFDKGVDTGIARLVTDENIKRFGKRPDGGCGNIIGVGKYPKVKIPPKNSYAQIWIASYKEVKNKMWKQRLEQLIPPEFLELNRNNEGWSEAKQLFQFKSSSQIRLITYEQKHKKAEGEKAWMVILDEEPPERNYFISALEHCKYLRICFTPFNGLGWSYYDCYLPAVNDINKSTSIYSCTQFDSPYHNVDSVKIKLKTYREYEIKARVFGMFSDMAGKPYYDYDIVQQFINNYVPRHTLAKIIPVSKCDTVREVLEAKIRLEPAEGKGEDVWEIYDKYVQTDAYWLSADVAEGNDNPNLAQNASVAYVRRLPRLDEGEKNPVMVAAIRSHMRNIEFAWTCLYAACYYNHALMAPETGVSVDGTVFVTTLTGYPFFYRHTSTNAKTNRLQEKFGFDTKKGSRKYAFDLVGTWVYDHMSDGGQIFHYPLLKEISECIVGKGGRPDHPDRGSTDCIMAFGISEYIYDLAKTQIRCNVFHKDVEYDPMKLAENKKLNFENILGLNAIKRETRPVLGSSRGLDRRFGSNQMTRQLLY